MEQKTPVKLLMAEHRNLFENLVKKFAERTGTNNEPVKKILGWMSVIPGVKSFSEIDKLVDYTKSFIEKIDNLDKANDSQSLELLNNYAIGLLESFMPDPDVRWSVQKSLAGPYIMDYLKCMRQLMMNNSPNASLKPLYSNLCDQKGTLSQPVDGGHVPAFYCLDFIIDIHNILKNYAGNNLDKILYNYQKEFYNQKSVKQYLAAPESNVNKELKDAFDEFFTVQKTS